MDASKLIIVGGSAGGSPAQFPARYAHLDMANWSHTGLPPAYIVIGTNDHAVPIAGVRRLIKQLHDAGQPYTYIEVPYADHAFNLNATSLSSQILWNGMDKFLKENNH